jgi:GTP cyclohydrolase II
LDELEKEVINMANPRTPANYIALTSHPGAPQLKPIPIHWGASDPQKRGPIIGTVSAPEKRNVIGTHGGSYSVYRALAIAAGALNPLHKADLTNTAPVETMGPFPAWHNAKKIVSLDPYGALVSTVFKNYLDQGFDILPTIAVTTAHISIPELQQAISQGRIKPDGKILLENGEVKVTKAALEPVWYLPGIAERFGCTEGVLRRKLFEFTAGMFPELMTRPDLEVFLPPIGGLTLYILGDVSTIADSTKPLTVRVHDECNGSDVFGSDICTCRPYLTYGIELGIESAQQGGAGVIVYNRKEGRALGEVTKFLVYNARKRQEGGDRAEMYFARTECVAGVQDMRFQELMPDVLHWLGITHIDRFVSMSNMKYEALAKSGITVKQRVTIPEEMVPEDAKVEMDAKIASGYFSDRGKPAETDLKIKKGRDLK